MGDLINEGIDAAINGTDTNSTLTDLVPIDGSRRKLWGDSLAEWCIDNSICSKSTLLCNSWCANIDIDDDGSDLRARKLRGYDHRMLTSLRDSLNAEVCSRVDDNPCDCWGSHHVCSISMSE